jgi:hypothetical protein
MLFRAQDILPPGWADDNPLLPDVIDAYPRNPWILPEQASALSALGAKYPRLSGAALAAVLDECFWLFPAAARMAGLLESEVPARASDPAFAQLQALFPHVAPEEVWLALELSDFAVDVARLYFTDESLRRVLAESVAAARHSRAFPLEPTWKPEPRAAVAAFEFEAAPGAADDSGARQRRERRVLTCDLHGCTRENSRSAVTAAIEGARTIGTIEKVNFITGRGKHSRGEVPTLRPRMLVFIERLGFAAEVMEKNPGIVQAFL